MLDVFKVVGTFFRRTRANTDSVLFRLHYHVTVAILLLFCLIVGINQYVRRPMICSAVDLPHDLLEAFCWTHTTYTVEYDRKLEPPVVQPGVTWEEEKKKKSWRFYQWVYLCLFVQAVMFYIPRWLWKNWEGGKLQALKKDLDIEFLSEAEKLDKKKLLLDYLQQNRNYNTWWTYKYFFCELLALINVLGQIFLMDSFLNGAFLSYGPNFVSYKQKDVEERIDPIISVFPRAVDCTFHRYSPAGIIVKHQAICVLPLNIYNENFYLFLWFWFFILLIATILWAIFRICLIFISEMRYCAMIVRYSHLRSDIVYKFSKDTGIGDWYLLYMLGENLDSFIFRDVLHELPEKYGSLQDNKYELVERL